MKMSVSSDVWKYALLTLSVLISLNGVALISIGVIVLGGAGSTNGAYIVTLLGVMVLTVAALGCFSAMRESYILSIWFIGTAAVTVVCQTIYVIAFAAMKDGFIKMTEERVLHVWQQEQHQRDSMFSIQIQYECCGKESPQDYLLDDDDVLPASCCRWQDCSIAGNIFDKGCSSSAVNFIDDHSDYMILSILSLVALEALGIISAYYFGKSLDDDSIKSEPIANGISE